MKRKIKVLIVDDGFGYDKYQEKSGMGLGNNFEQLALQLKEANGRVKVLITSRQDVLAQACENTKLSSAILSAYLVPIPSVTLNLQPGQPLYLLPAEGTRPLSQPYTLSDSAFSTHFSNPIIPQ